MTVRGSWADYARIDRQLIALAMHMAALAREARTTPKEVRPCECDRID